MSFIGIDVAKAQLDFAARPSDQSGAVPSDEVGIHMEDYQDVGESGTVLQAVLTHEAHNECASHTEQCQSKCRGHGISTRCT
jgi:hypothetical protein